MTVAPVIGLTTWRRELPTYLGASTDLLTLAAEYVTAVRAAGGVPVLLPDLTPDEAAIVASRLDGLLLSGGGDVAPSAYGSTATPADDVDPQRDEAEFALLDRARYEGLPTFGICRGLQLINVAFGGTLIDDLPVTGEHPRSSDPSTLWNHRHRVRLAGVDWPASGLVTADDGSVTVNTIHHQAIAALGPGLRAVAHSADGLIEAVEGVDDGWFVRAVQWHPEKMHGPTESGHGAALLGELIDAARARASRSATMKENV